jgi:hypothetical protein
MNAKQSNSLNRCIRKPIILLSVGLALTLGGIARADTAAHSNNVSRAQAIPALLNLARPTNCGPDGIRICTPHGCYCA